MKKNNNNKYILKNLTVNMSEVKARTVLWYLVFVGFAVNYMIRINLNITIVEMVRNSKLKSIATQSSDLNYKNDSNELSTQTLENVNHISGNTTKTLIDNRTVQRKTIEIILLDGLNIKYEENGFSWNEYEQGLVLGSFFWLHWVTQIPGGILAKKYGTKLVFGLANVIGCWICFILPIVSYIDYKLLVFVRIIQGLICGLAWPAMHHMTSVWIPPNERSKFVTAYLGSSIGIAVFYPLFGYILAISSWEWVYHICGIIGTVWYISWLYFVYDTPALHPRIKQNELEFIEKSLGKTVLIESKQNKTPWKEILTSKAVWINVIAQWGGIWGLFTLMTQAPTYFRHIHNWNIGMTGMLSGFPHFARMIFAYIFSIYGDHVLKTNKMSTTNIRKLATFVCCIVKGLLVLALAYSGNSSLAAVIFLTLATMVHGAVSTGPLASIVDIAPNYAGVVLGISGMIGVLPGFISPIIVGMLTLGNQTSESWKYVFLITSGMLIGSGILYVLFSDSTLQSWNSPQTNNNNILDKEMQLLNSNNSNNYIDNNKKLIVNNDDKKYGDKICS